MKQLLILFLFSSCTFSNERSIHSINEYISNNYSNNLIKKKIDLNLIDNKTYDGGRVLFVYYQNDLIFLIEDILGVSHGRMTTKIYFKNLNPIKIIFTEEVFKWDDEKSTFDYSNLNLNYKKEAFILNQNLKDNFTNSEGKRRFTKKEVNISEYLDLLEKIKSNN